MKSPSISEPTSKRDSSDLFITVSLASALILRQLWGIEEEEIPVLSQGPWSSLLGYRSVVAA